jgi:hypothetical protein
MARTGSEAWGTAAACEALAHRSKDDKLREMFLKLRDSWIRIANNTQPTGDSAHNEGRSRNQQLP